MDSHEVSRRLHAARKFSVDGGRRTLNLFRNPQIEFERKGDDTPVTSADRDAEHYIRGEIARDFPGDGIIGEEHGTEEGETGFEWILDPIDGTKSFITGVPLFGTMVGVRFENNHLIGAIYFPGIDEGIYAAKGQGSWSFRGEKQSVRATCSKRSSLSDCIFVTSEVRMFNEVGADDVYRQLERDCYITRTWGDCYGYFLVATGRADLMIDPVLSIWDAAAAKPIVEEAGGAFVDWSGNEFDGGTNAIGCNSRILDDVVQLTRPHSNA